MRFPTPADGTDPAAPRVALVAATAAAAALASLITVVCADGSIPPYGQLHLSMGKCPPAQPLPR